MDLMALILTSALFVSLTFATDLDVDIDAAARNERRRQDRMGSRRKKLRPNHIYTHHELVDELLTNYVKSEPPMKDAPTEVRLGIYINSFYSISEQTMEYSVNFYLRQSWRDPRLEYTPQTASQKVLKIEHHLSRIWVPDVFFRNEKRASYHDITIPNVMLTLNATGHVWYVRKISATLACPMKLQKYPFDTQTCPMMFESFGYTMDTLYFAWLDEPVDIDKSVQLPQFTLEDYILYDCSQNYTAGAFPCLELSFVLRRDIGYFLIQTYMPSILIVILSWVSFWINAEASPARVSLGLLTVLAMSTHSNGARASLPRVSYIKAIDVWMSVCQIFVFASLIEYAFVNVYYRKKPSPPPLPGESSRSGALQRLISKTRSACQAPKHMESNPDTAQGNQINIVENHSQARDRDTPRPAKRSEADGKSKAQRIDKISRKMFPLSFMFFNIVYWILYTIPSGIGP